MTPLLLLYSTNKLYRQSSYKEAALQGSLFSFKNKILRDNIFFTHQEIFASILIKDHSLRLTFNMAIFVGWLKGVGAVGGRLQIVSA